MIILVTGATAGFGRAIALELAAAGHTVIASGRRRSRLDQLAAEAADATGTLVTRALDVTRSLAVGETIAEIERNVGPIDILVNNAGLALGLAPAQSVELDDWENMVDTNIKGLLYCTHAVLPGMVRRDRGYIINLGSVAGNYPYPGSHVYGASKAFVHQFSRNLRADLLGTRIRVTCLEPGLCGGTEFSLTRFKGDADKAEAVYRGTKPLTAEDIAQLVAYLIGLPAHINVNQMELMPTCQAFGPFAVSRTRDMQ